jgi:acetyl esterase/lipase
MMSPQGEQIRNQIKNVFGPRLKAILETPLEIRRPQFEALMSRAGLPPDVEIEEVEAARVPCEWVRMVGGAPEPSPPVLIYLHSGAYLLVAALARVTGRVALSVNYRLAPAHPFPAALEDAVAVYQWLLASGRGPGSLLLAGFSAGGGLALATLVALRDAGDPLPKGAILLSPCTDLAASGASHRTNVERDLISTPALVREARSWYLGERDPRTPLASPLYPNLQGLPPLLIHVGSDELLRDDSTQLAERAQAVGVRVTLHIGEGMWHGWHATAARTMSGGIA